jgi:hypothetical protein
MSSRGNGEGSEIFQFTSDVAGNTRGASNYYSASDQDIEAAVTLLMLKRKTVLSNNRSNMGTGFLTGIDEVCYLLFMWLGSLSSLLSDDND